MNKKNEMLPKLTVDRKLSVAYIQFRDARVAQRLILDDEDTLIADLDSNGDIIGIEIVSLLRLERLVREVKGSAEKHSLGKSAASSKRRARPLSETEIPMYVIPFVFAKEGRLSAQS